MADDQDEFGALYGDLEDTAVPRDDKTSAQQEALNTAAASAEDDESLFLQLYGGQPAPDTAPSISNKYIPEAAVVKNTSHLPINSNLTIPDNQPPTTAITGEDEDEDDDDLMITLDDNATAYEPSQNKFQYSRPAFNPSSHQSAIGSAPGQQQPIDDALHSSIPGLGGAFGKSVTGATVIGGIPRSAIPGLTPTLITDSAPSSQQQQQQQQDFSQSQSLHGHGELPRQSHLRSFRKEDAVFPSQWKPGLPIKLPGQTRVSPEEYKEFLSLGHGDVFDLDLDSVIEPPWRYPGIDPGDFFNYGMTETTWRQYIDSINKFRLEFFMKKQIQTVDAGGGSMGSGGMGSQHYASMGDAPTMMMPPHGQPMMIAGGGEEVQDGDQALKSSIQETRDDHYETFVTSERPAKFQWTRFGSSWDHTIILTGHDVVFNDKDITTITAVAGEEQAQQQFGDGTAINMADNNNPPPSFQAMARPPHPGAVAPMGMHPPMRPPFVPRPPPMDGHAMHAMPMPPLPQFMHGPPMQQPFPPPQQQQHIHQQQQFQQNRDSGGGGGSSGGLAMGMGMDVDIRQPRHFPGGRGGPPRDGFRRGGGGLGGPPHQDRGGGWDRDQQYNAPGPPSSQYRDGPRDIGRRGHPSSQFNNGDLRRSQHHNSGGNSRARSPTGSRDRHRSTSPRRRSSGGKRERSRERSRSPSRREKKGRISSRK